MEAVEPQLGNLTILFAQAGSFHVDRPSSFSATMRSPIIIRASLAVVWPKPFARSHVSAA
jgi:hypothetical protein